LLLISSGVALVILSPIIPVYYSGGGSFTSSYFEIIVPVPPNSFHIHVAGSQEVNVELVHPNGTTLALWRGVSIDGDYVLFESGLWRVYVSASRAISFQFEICTKASIMAHPALIYASGIIVLGSLSFLYSKNKRKRSSLSKDALFEQNIGGRWVFAAWLPIFAFIAEAPRLIPRYPWLYVVLIIVTVTAVISCIALAYIKLYVSLGGIFIEGPFLNFSRRFRVDQILGFEVTKEERRRWFLLWQIPDFKNKKEDSITIFLSQSIPRWLQVLVLGARLVGNTISFRPKIIASFTSAMNRISISERRQARI
jgi:hypothetical protein